MVLVVQHIQDALVRMQQNEISLIIMVDSGKQIDNLNSMIKITRLATHTPILILASQYNASVKIEAIKLGADEYLSAQSIALEHIMSGISLIRRYAERKHSVRPITLIRHRELLLMVECRKAFLRNSEIDLSRKEFDLLFTLLKHRSRVYSYQQLYHMLWQDTPDDETTRRAVWRLVNRIRRKLRSSPETAKSLVTVRDIGYRIDT